MGRLIAQFEENVATLLATARAAGLEVIHVHELFDDDRSKWLPFHLARGAAKPFAGTEGALPLTGAEPLNGELVFVKQKLDAFRCKELVDYLKSSGKMLLFFAGLTTSVCVLSSALSAFQEGYTSVIISDCSSDFGAAHEQALQRFRGWAVESITLADFQKHTSTLPNAKAKL